ncbi:hypothetical protein LXL04_036652 [Taraxacum kok-saghyz]
MASDVDALVRSEVCARVAMFKSRPRNFPPRRHASTYVLTTIVAGVTARYMHQDEPLHPWMMFIDYGIITAVCVLVLEGCMYFKLLEAVQGRYRLGDLSNVMTWLAVMLGASGFVATIWSVEMVDIYDFICTQLAPPHLPARAYALAIIVAVVGAQPVLPDEPWVMFVNGSLILAVCVLVLEASMLVVLQDIQAQFRVGDLSNMMAWLAVIWGACGYMARLIQHGSEGTGPILFCRTLGLCFVLQIMMGSVALVVLGAKWQNRD